MAPFKNIIVHEGLEKFYDTQIITIKNLQYMKEIDIKRDNSKNYYLIGKGIFITFLQDQISFFLYCKYPIIKYHKIKFSENSQCLEIDGRNQE